MVGLLKDHVTEQVSVDKDVLLSLQLRGCTLKLHHADSGRGHKDLERKGKPIRFLVKGVPKEWHDFFVPDGSMTAAIGLQHNNVGRVHLQNRAKGAFAAGL